MLKILNRFLPANFEDFLCMVILGGIITMWFCIGLGVMVLENKIIDATIAFFGIIASHYFFKHK
jgi:hypothetical protein